jgi:hypothetical protein
MKNPKLAAAFTILLLLALLAQDVLMTGDPAALEVIEGVGFASLGGVLGAVLLSHKQPRRDPLDPHKLDKQVLEDENRQLKQKIATLEAALKRYAGDK